MTEVKVTSISILTGDGADKLYLHTTLPVGTWPYEGNASLRLDVASKNGAEYAAEHFPGVPVEVREIGMRSDNG
jgi:hypothetical protein